VAYVEGTPKHHSSRWGTPRKYMQDLVTTHRNDKRILMWDLYNEPMNRAKVGMSKAQVGGLRFLESAFLWV